MYFVDETNKSGAIRGAMYCAKHMIKYAPPFTEKEYLDEEYNLIYLNGDGCPDCYADAIEKHRKKREKGGD